MVKLASTLIVLNQFYFIEIATGTILPLADHCYDHATPPRTVPEGNTDLQWGQSQFDQYSGSSLISALFVFGLNLVCCIRFFTIFSLVSPSSVQNTFKKD